MAKDTKERILQEALIMFAERGYEGTNMRELAQALGFGKSALYKHYASKEEIWNSLMDQIEDRYSQQFGSGGNPPRVPASCDDFLSMAKGMLDYALRDHQVKTARRILLAEQFHNQRARDLAAEHFLVRFDRVFAPLFEGMMNAGLIKQDDPQMLALEFSAPISALIMQCDRFPEQEDELVGRMHASMEHFVKVYGVGR